MIPGSLYVIGGLGLVSVLAVGYATLEHSWRQNAEIVAAQEKEANKKNQETIAILEKSNELSNKIAMELSEQLGAITAKQEEEDAAVTELAGSDEEVRKFLSTPIPAKLKCLWLNQQCPNGTPSPNPN